MASPITKLEVIVTGTIRPADVLDQIAATFTEAADTLGAQRA